MPVRDLVGEPLAIAGVARSERKARVEAALAEVSLTPPGQFLDSYAHQLSGGQRQRVAIARALVASPRLVVADEPVSMLDVSLQAGILDLLLRLRTDHGITFEFITHDLAVARHVADRVAVMFQGRLVELGTADGIVDEPRHPYTEALLAAVEQLAVPPPALGGLPPGGHPCQRHGQCDPSSEACRCAEPAFVEVAPGHFCACHVGDPDREPPPRGS